MGGILSPIPTDAIPTLMSEGKLITHPKAGLFFTTFNTHDRLFSNKKIRQALTLAIDRNALVEHVTQLNEDIALGVVPHIMKEESDDLAFFKDHDIEKARAFFAQGCAELGIDPQKFPTTHCLYLKTELQKKIAQTLQQQWREALGIRMEIEHLEIKTLLDRLSNKDYQIGLIYWLAQYNDPMSLLERFSTSDIQKNFSGWTSERFQQLISLSCDINNRNERLKVLREAEEALIEEMPIAPLFYIRYAYLINPKLKNLSFMSTRGIQVRWASFGDQEANSCERPSN
jgi:oligopeptide transport system substrate-binding protein